jgi:hypothetical protein
MMTVPGDMSGYKAKLRNIHKAKAVLPDILVLPQKLFGYQFH